MLSYISSLFYEQQSFIIKSYHFVPYSITYTQRPRVEYKRDWMFTKFNSDSNLPSKYIRSVDYINMETIPHVKPAHYVLIGDVNYYLKLSPEQYTKLFIDPEIDPIGKTIKYYKWFKIFWSDYVTDPEIIEI